MRATLNFTLPDDSDEFEAALAGNEALRVLWEIDSHCRSLLKHGEPTPESAALAKEIRDLIPFHLLDKC